MTPALAQRSEEGQAKNVAADHHGLCKNLLQTPPELACSLAGDHAVFRRVFLRGSKCRMVPAAGLEPATP